MRTGRRRRGYPYGASEVRRRRVSPEGCREERRGEPSREDRRRRISPPATRDVLRRENGPLDPRAGSRRRRPDPAAPGGLRPDERKRRKDEERPGGVGRGGGSHRSWRQVDQSATFLPPGFHRRRLGPIRRRPDSHFVVVAFRSRNQRPPSVAIAASARLSALRCRDVVRGSLAESALVDLENAYRRKS